MERVFRIRTFYGQVNAKGKVKWIQKSKRLFDDDKEYEKARNRLLKVKERRKDSLFKLRVIFEEFQQGAWIPVDDTENPENPEHIPGKKVVQDTGNSEAS